MHSLFLQHHELVFLNRELTSINGSFLILSSTSVCEVKCNDDSSHVIFGDFNSGSER